MAIDHILIFNSLAFASVESRQFRFKSFRTGCENPNSLTACRGLSSPSLALCIEEAERLLLPKLFDHQSVADQHEDGSKASQHVICGSARTEAGISRQHAANIALEKVWLCDKLIQQQYHSNE